MEDKVMLLILYASQTGNAMDAAERLGREAERRGCPVAVLSTDLFDASTLPDEKIIVFVVSTTGQGDPPDSLKVFWRKLLQRNLAKDWLEGVNYALFGLGDSGYQKYNFVAKKLDKRLSDLGATALIERGLGDDQHPSGYEGALDPWMSSLWNTLYEKNPKLFPKGPGFVIPNMEFMDKPKMQVVYHEADKVASHYSNNADLKFIEMQIERARSMSPGQLYHEKNRPDCFLKMTKNHPLTVAGCGKDVHHFEFEPRSSIIEYEVGDVLEILPGQSPAAIDAFIQRCNLNPDAYITVHPRGTENHLLDSKVPIKLRTFVEFTMDVASASPRRYFFEVMSYFASAQHEKERLQYFASPEGRDDLYQYNQKERRTVLEVSIYQLGLTKVPSFLHHHHFPSFSSDLELVVHLFEVLPRKEPYKVNLVQLLRLSSSLVAEMKIMTFYTKIFGSPIHKMVGYSQKIEVEASMLPSRETSQTRFTCNTRCGNIAIGCGICYARVRPSMLQVHQPKCLRMLCQHLRKLYRRRVGFRGKLLSGGLGHWKRLVSIMSKLGLELSALFFDSSDNLGDEKRLTGLVLENFK